MTDEANIPSIGSTELFDLDRLALFTEVVDAMLRLPTPPPMPLASEPGRYEQMPFFEAYFTNYIEGIHFSLDEASAIIDAGDVSAAPPGMYAEAYDLLGTYEIVSNDEEMSRTPGDADELIDLLLTRHAQLLRGHPAKQPGEFKLRSNRAGGTVFVEPVMVRGTLRAGFEQLTRLTDPFHRAAFMKFMISEIHPFADGNGRMSRIMMNAELHAAGEQRIVIPTIYRRNYLLGLVGLSRDAKSVMSYLAMLDYARRWTAEIYWGDRELASKQLEKCNAFVDSIDARDMNVQLHAPRELGSRMWD